ncbi:hypothetical protein ASD32_28325 [Rhizobium sp. Root483D2]|nr:hypothetical protein ASD32_28325 [Rhizobium sp. Root483D2]
MLKLYNIADAMVTGADGTDFTVVGMRLTIMATVDITSVAAVIVDITAYGFPWVRLPPAPLLGARLQIGRFDTEGAMWSGAPIVTAATGHMTILTSPTTGRGACVIPHIEQHQSQKMKNGRG